MNLVGKGQSLTPAGLNKAQTILGLGANDATFIWTVVEVETAGLPARGDLAGPSYQLLCRKARIRP